MPTLAQASDRVHLWSPVLVKELRTRMRGSRPVWLQAGYVFIMLLVMGGTYAAEVGTTGTVASTLGFRLGRAMFQGLFIVQAVLVALLELWRVGGRIVEVEHGVEVAAEVPHPLEPAATTVEVERVGHQARVAAARLDGNGRGLPEPVDPAQEAHELEGHRDSELVTEGHELPVALGRPEGVDAVPVGRWHGSDVLGLDLGRLVELPSGGLPRCRALGVVLGHPVPDPDDEE